MIDLHDVSKVYQIGEERVHALDHVTLHIFPKEFVSVIGPSGSGKSTLMNIIGCLDVADAGTYRLDGIPIEDYSEKQLARVRNQKIGFIFQNFNLIAKLSAEENVELPLVYRGVRPAERARRVAAALERVGSCSRTNRPATLTPKPAARSWTFSMSCTSRETPLCSSRTTTTLPVRPSAASTFSTGASRRCSYDIIL